MGQRPKRLQYKEFQEIPASSLLQHPGSFSGREFHSAVDSQMATDGQDATSWTYAISKQ